MLPSGYIFSSADRLHRPLPPSQASYRHLMSKRHITIVTPATPGMRNGNWNTTSRWKRFLAPHYSVNVAQEWTDQPCDLMIALHAHKSAASIQHFRQTAKPIVVVLTGTDLYRDIHQSQPAQESLQAATRLVVLQERGRTELPPELRSKCVVIEQSAIRSESLPPREATFDFLLVGHLRPEKDPLTALRAFSRLPAPQLRLRHVGATDDFAVGPPFRRAAASDPRIELLGSRSHDETRDIIRRGRVLLLPSVMEGGANVLIEATVTGVPTLASRIPGSVGLLGDTYNGYFSVGNDQQLAELMEQCVESSGFLTELTRQASSRRHRFRPERERQKLLALVASLLPANGSSEVDI